MYLYKQSEHGLYTVGSYENGKWQPESDHVSTDEAARRVAFLNGGQEYPTIMTATTSKDHGMQIVYEQTGNNFETTVYFDESHQIIVSIIEHTRRKKEFDGSVWIFDEARFAEKFPLFKDSVKTRQKTPFKAIRDIVLQCEAVSQHMDMFYRKATEEETADFYS